MKRRAIWLGKPIEALLRETHYPTSSLRILTWVALRELADTPLPPHLQDLLPIVGMAILGKRLRPELVQRLPHVVDTYLAAHQVAVATRARTYAILLSLSPLLRVKLILEGRCIAVDGVGGLVPRKTAASAPIAADSAHSLDSTPPAPAAMGGENATDHPAPSVEGGDS